MSVRLPAEARPAWPNRFRIPFVLAAGALHALSFAPWTLWWGQVLMLASLLWLWLPELDTRPRSGWLKIMFTPWLFSTTWFGTGLCWLYISMHDYGDLPAPIAAAAVLLLSAFLALFACIAFLTTVRLAGYQRHQGVLRRLRAAAVFAAGWTFAEWLRGVAFTGFPWIAIGYAHVDSPLAGWAPLVGVYAVSGLAALLAFLIADLALSFSQSMSAATPVVASVDASTGASAKSSSAAVIVVPVAVLLMITAVGWVAQKVQWATPSGPMLNVRLLQGNVPQQLKFVPQQSYRAMQAYSRMVAQPSAMGELDLTVLPETAWTVPWAATDPALIEQMFPPDRRQPRLHVAIGMPLPLPSGAGTGRGAGAGAGADQAGALTAEMILQGRVANSVLLLRADQLADQSQRYDKHHLVPFGEVVPFGFQWFVNLMNIPLGSFARGSLEQQPFLIRGQRVAFNICYEDLFGEQLARAVRTSGGSANILVNVSNIAWFGRSHALTQHLQIARMRSLELARPMLRSTNTGMTASIDARGNVRAVLEHHTVGVLEDEVQGMTGETPFARWTHWPALSVSALIIILAAWRQRAGKTLSR